MTTEVVDFLSKYDKVGTYVVFDIDETLLTVERKLFRCSWLTEEQRKSCEDKENFSVVYGGHPYRLTRRMGELMYLRGVVMKNGLPYQILKGLKKSKFMFCTARSPGKYRRLRRNMIESGLVSPNDELKNVVMCGPYGNKLNCVISYLKNEDVKTTILIDDQIVNVEEFGDQDRKDAPFDRISFHYTPRGNKLHEYKM